MIEIMDSKRMIELVLEKHRKLLETYGTEFSELESKFNILKQQSDSIKKEMDSTESRIAVLTEKYHLLFYQAKKQREETFNSFIENIRKKAGAANLNDLQRLGSRIEEFEKKLQNSQHIEDEERGIVEIKKLLYDLESAGRKAEVPISINGVIEKLNDANLSHKELLSLQDRPKQNAEFFKNHERQRNEMEGRYNWLKHRIESHNNALIHWEKQKAGVIA